MKPVILMIFWSVVIVGALSIAGNIFFSWSILWTAGIIIAIAIVVFCLIAAALVQQGKQMKNFRFVDKKTKR